jgi:hypothetical protein
VQGDVIEVFKANHSEQVTQNYYVKGMNVVVEGMTGLTVKVGGNFITINPGGVFITGTMVMINSGGAAGSGTAGSPVPPVAPLAAAIADTAIPGKEVTYRQQRAQMTPAQLAALSAPSHKPTEEDKQKKSWIEIELVDEEDNPVPGERYRVTLPDGKTLAEGTLDEMGYAKISGIDPGTCKITFPELDKDAWERGSGSKGAGGKSSGSTGGGQKSAGSTGSDQKTSESKGTGPSNAKDQSKLSGSAGGGKKSSGSAGSDQKIDPDSKDYEEEYLLK